MAKTKKALEIFTAFFVFTFYTFTLTGFTMSHKTVSFFALNFLFLSGLQAAELPKEQALPILAHLIAQSVTSGRKTLNQIKRDQGNAWCSQNKATLDLVAVLIELRSTPKTQQLSPVTPEHYSTSGMFLFTGFQTNKPPKEIVGAKKPD